MSKCGKQIARNLKNREKKPFGELPNVCNLASEMQRIGLLGCETIADPLFGDDIPWLGWVVLDFAPKCGDEHPQVVRFVRIVRPPNLPQQKTMREHLAGVPHEQNQEFVFEGRQMNRLAPSTNDPRGEVDPYLPDFEDGRLATLRVTVTQGGAHPGQ